MDIGKLRSFLLWCTVLNTIILFITLAGALGMPDFIYDLHMQWFGISRNTVNITMYAFLGCYKLFWLFFNVIPLIALSLVKWG